jgi:hypothetical protein
MERSRLKSLSRYERVKEEPQISNMRSFVGDFDSIPGCFGYYPKAIQPNKCELCIYRELCMGGLRNEH